VWNAVGARFMFVLVYVVEALRRTAPPSKGPRRIKFLNPRNARPLTALTFSPTEKKIYSFCLMVEASHHGCLTHKTYTCHTVQNTIRYDIRFTGMKGRYIIFERVTMYNNAKRTLRKLQRFISTVILL
jgi:hypothetical protein